MRIMKRIIFIFLFFAMAAQSGIVLAQRQISEEDRARWSQRVREVKHSFLVSSLGLSREQQNEFFPLYDKMEDEINAITAQNRDLENRLLQDDKASDSEYSAAARTLFEQKGKESEIELEFYKQFESILTPRQLFRLKSVEREFLAKMVRQHGQRSRNDIEEPDKDKHPGPRRGK